MQQVDARVDVYVVFYSAQTSGIICKAGYCRGVGKCSRYGLRVTVFLAPILVVACEQMHLESRARHGSRFSLLCMQSSRCLSSSASCSLIKREVGLGVLLSISE